MTERERRLEKLAQVLTESDDPRSGAELAKLFNVSRQAIVQDVALLRDRGLRVLATARGYVHREAKPRRIFPVRHGVEEIADELNTMIEAGGRVIDVVVDHPVYGEIQGNLDLASREDVARFVNILRSTGQSPLLSLSRGFHAHTVEADDDMTLDAIEKALADKGYLEMS
ncbi:MAG: transcription repressor NadR [Thermovirgaceae bacterium]|nr:transcription repressor NadR [Synergistales bacterium]HRS48477.1 transcription repressor NadR [Thermovirgaceae bacterium]HRU90760.1 transcription repressor NadR [Thermovirgaceae bacterium]